MTRALLLVGLVAAFPAAAKTPEDIGRIFADVTACRIAGEYNEAEKVGIDLAVIHRYKVGQKGHFWKKRMEAGQLEEFERLDGIKPLEKVLMCSILKDKWL